MKIAMISITNAKVVMCVPSSFSQLLWSSHGAQARASAVPDVVWADADCHMAKACVAHHDTVQGKPEYRQAWMRRPHDERLPNPLLAGCRRAGSHGRHAKPAMGYTATGALIAGCGS
jgi:hypothetical protein